MSVLGGLQEFGVHRQDTKVRQQLCRGTVVYEPLDFELRRFGSALLEVSVLLPIHRDSVDEGKDIE